MLSFREWELLKNEVPLAQSRYPPDESESQTEKVIKVKTSSKVQKLCRVCNSNGLISIFTPVRSHKMKISIKNQQNWNVSIAQVISEISGENVSENGNLNKHFVIS